MPRIARALLLAASLSGPAAAHAREPGPDRSAAGATDSTVADSARVTAADGTATTARWRLRERSSIEGEPGHPLVEPSGVLSDAFGRVWVSDASLHTLRRWQADGAPLDETGALGSEPAQFRRPGALARVGALGVAVLDVENRRVSTYDHYLRLLQGTVDLAAPELEERIGRVRPVALAADRGGALYVADAERDRVLVFDYAGAFQRELGGFGARSGGFSGLTGVAVGARGTLVTAERPAPRRGKARARSSPPDSAAGRGRVQWLDAGGRVIGATWTPPWAAGAAEISLSVAVDAAGRVAVAAERSGELCVLSPQGECLARLAGLSAPRALAFADDGTLLVAESGAGRVRRWSLEPDGAE